MKTLYYIDNYSGLPSGPYDADERAEIGDGDGWTWADTADGVWRVFTFVVDGAETEIVARNEVDALAVANARIDLPDGFYAWMKGLDYRFRAVKGVWD